MSKTSAPPVAANDFVKSNGTVSADHAVFPVGPSMTRQEFADEADINNIMRQYDSYLSDPMRSVREPIYYDFTTMPDSLMGAMEVLHRAESAFYSLPAEVRKEFDNNAALFADFAADPENLEQMRSWGLAKPAPVEERPMRVEVVSPPAPVSGASESSAKSSATPSGGSPNGGATHGST